MAELLPTHGALVTDGEPRNATNTQGVGNSTIVGDVTVRFTGSAWPLNFLLHVVRQKLCEIWKEPDLRLKKCGLMLLAGSYLREDSPADAGLDSFLMVLVHALDCAHLLRYCANPGCKEPYFVAARGSQIYCSEPCAKPAQREAKLRWWNDKGKGRRTKRGKKTGAKHHAKAKKA